MKQYLTQEDVQTAKESMMENENDERRESQVEL